MAPDKVVGLFVQASKEEVPATLSCFFSLFCILASYFLVVPLREDAGIALGTSYLPVLFSCSLLVTLLATPAASAFLSRPTPSARARALRQFYTMQAAVLLGFYALYHLAALHALVARMPLLHDLRRPGQGHGPPVWHARDPHLLARAVERGATAAAAAAAAGAVHEPYAARRRSLLSSWPPGAAALPDGDGGGSSGSSGPVLRVRLASHPATGSGNGSWSAAEATAPAAFRRLQELQERRAGAGAPGLPVGAPAGNADAGGAANSSGAGAGGRRRVDSRTGDPDMSWSQRLLRVSFYLWTGASNLIGISSAWAAAVNAFSSSQGSRLFGFISAGATLGQLGGSLVAMLAARAADTLARKGAVGPPTGLILLAALLQLAAAQLLSRVRQQPPGAAAPAAGGEQARPRAPSPPRPSLDGGSAAVALSPLRAVSSSGGAGSAKAAAALAPRGGLRLGSVLRGFRLILSSRYLMLLCANMLLTYIVGSLLYFQRALVVSTSVRGAKDRTAFYATLNSWSAAGILAMQLFATSSLLRRLSMSAALGVGPAICLAGLAAICAHPTPSTVALVEVVRKLFGYALYRPAREVLFTVVSREEKYSAKLVIDTVVQRLGDTVAAAAFQVLDVQLRLGTAGVGAAGCVMCLVWLATAARLGQQHKRLAAGSCS